MLKDIRDIYLTQPSFTYGRINDANVTGCTCAAC